jgi:hypothetical protein
MDQQSAYTLWFTRYVTAIERIIIADELLIRLHEQ